jgi:transcriptional regulator with XRE-family HTH domain
MSPKETNERGDKMKNNNVAMVIKRYRSENGISQEQLSTQLGVSRNHISNLETGKKDPSHKLMERIIVTMWDIFFEIYVPERNKNSHQNIKELNNYENRNLA